MIVHGLGWVGLGWVWGNRNAWLVNSIDRWMDRSISLCLTHTHLCIPPGSFSPILLFSSPRSVDGGASANNLLLKMQADIIGMTVRRPADLETTALGAALAAGVGINLWTYNSVLDNEQDVHVFTPEMNGSKRESAIWRWKEAVKVSIAWGTPH